MSSSFGRNTASGALNSDKPTSNFSANTEGCSKWSSGSHPGSPFHLSRPRLAKIRRPATRHSRQTSAGESQTFCSGVNLFTPPYPENYHWADQSASTSFGAFIFKTKNDSSNLHAHSIEKDLTDDIRKLNINRIEPGKAEGDKHRSCPRLRTGLDINGRSSKHKISGQKVHWSAAFDGDRMVGLEGEMTKLNINASPEGKGLNGSSNLGDVMPNLRYKYMNNIDMSCSARSGLRKSNITGLNEKEIDNHPNLNENERSTPGGVHSEVSINSNLASALPCKFKMLSINCKEPGRDKTNVYDNSNGGFVFGATGEGTISSGIRISVFPKHRTNYSMKQKPHFQSSGPSIDPLFESKKSQLSYQMGNMRIRSEDMPSFGEQASGTRLNYPADNVMIDGLNFRNACPSNDARSEESKDHVYKFKKLSESASPIHSQVSSEHFGEGHMNQTSASFEFLSKSNILGEQIEFCAKKEASKSSMLKRRMVKLKHLQSMQKKDDFASMESHCQLYVEPSELYSPMDVSPCPEGTPPAQSEGEFSSASYTASHLKNSNEATAPHSMPSKTFSEDIFVDCTKRLSVDEVVSSCDEVQTDHYDHNIQQDSHAQDPLRDFLSRSETESFKSANEHSDIVSDATFVTAKSDVTVDSNFLSQESDNAVNSYFFSEKIDLSNFTFSASLPSQDQLSSTTQHRSRKVKFNQGPPKVPSTFRDVYSFKSLDSCSSSQPSPTALYSGSQRPNDFSFDSKNGVSYHRIKKQGCKKVPASASLATPSPAEACDKWRIRGNQAYENGEFSRAEDCYTQGVNCVPQEDISRSSLRALMLCHSNRAATRMAVGRVRDALVDCMAAVSIDPNFMRVQLRAANCSLALGDVEAASHYFKKCLSESCVDRKIAIQASEGLRNAQNVLDSMNRCEDLLRNGGPSAAENVLGIIGEALLVCSFSDRLLEMKAKALLTLRKFAEVIQLCDWTLSFVQKGLSIHSQESPKGSISWIWCHGLSFESYFHMGKFEEALLFIEKQEGLGLDASALRNSIPLVATTREMLRHKAIGNESFQSGRHEEAVQHYTVALSCSMESRPFAAICFSNRAAAYKALGQVVDAIADCSASIALDANYLKALKRRASLFEMVRCHEQAVIDLERYVSALKERRMEEGFSSPNGNSSLNELREAELYLQKMEEESRKDIPLDLHLILGIPHSACEKDVRKAYHRAALRHHPDKAGQNLGVGDSGASLKEITEEFQKDADKLFKMIAEAYAILSDPSKRARYLVEEEARKEHVRSSARNTSGCGEFHDCPYTSSDAGRAWRHVWRSYGHSQARRSDAVRPARNY